MIAWCWLVAVALTAQTRLTGRVTDTAGAPVARAILKVYADGSDSLLTYGSSGSDGTYALTVKATAPRLRVKVSHLSFRTAEVTAENRTHRLPDVRLTPGGEQLREVTVRAQPVRARGDTLTYDVGAMKSADDRNIEDVLRRIPGITVGGDGVIKYNDEPINRFYIEGANMLGGSYKIATQNVRPDDVSSVDVYRNHQPIRALKDVEFSKQAALNLKLKKRSLSRPIGYVRGGAGGGCGAAWTGEAFMLLVARSHQHIVTAKGGNFGQDYSSELANVGGFGPSTVTPLAAGLFSENVFAAGAVAGSRYRKGTSAIASSRNLFKLSDVTTLTVEGSYGYGDGNFGTDRTTDYLGADGARIVVDELGQTSLRHQTGRLNFKLEHNADRLYFCNELLLTGNFDRNRYAAGGTVTARQRNATDSYGLADELDFVHRRGKRTLRLWLSLKYGKTPVGHLRAVDPDADTLLADQLAGGSALRFSAQTDFGWSLGRAGSLRVAAQVAAAHDQLDTESAQGVNDAAGYRIVTMLGPQYTGRSKWVNWKLCADVSMYDMSFRDRVDGQRYSLHRPYFTPRLDVTFFLPEHNTVSVTAGYDVRFGALEAFVVHPVWTTYRERRTMGNGELPCTRRFNAGGSYRTENVFKGYNISVSGNFSLMQRDRMASSEVSATGTQLASVATDNTARQWSAALSAMRNIFVARTILRLNAMVDGMRSRMLRSSALYTTRSLTAMVGLSARRPFWNDRFIVEAGGTWAGSGQHIDGLAEATRFNNVSADVSLSAFPLKDWEIYVKGTYSANDMGGDVFRHDVFLDGGMRFSRGRWEAELQARNLTNRRVYVVRSVSALDVTTETYRLRPMEALLTLRYNF